MLARLRKALTSPGVGPTASAVAIVLAAALAASWTTAARDEAALKAQVAALSSRAEASGAYWKAQLTACRAEAATNKTTGLADRLTRVAGDDEAVARRLASEGPAGFDTCARMEAADQAVLASLKAK